MRILTTLVLALMLLHHTASSQSLIESVIVETYYISDANDATDTDGANPDALAEGSVTYRVFLDLAPGCEVTAMFGDTNHVFRIASTEFFWNNGDRGEIYGWQIPNNRLDENTVALDSWLSFGAASDAHWGALKSDDPDGSIVGGANNDGGSNGISGGLLVNDDPGAGIPLTDQDGLLPAADPTPTNWVRVGDAPGAILDDATVDSVFSSTNFLLQAPLGASGPTAENRLLVAQLTTSGQLSFALNVQVRNADGDVFNYVAGGDTLLPGEVEFGQLNYPPECGCTDPDFLEYDPGAGCPDPDACLTPIVFGCNDPNACNYDPAVNFNIPGLCCFGPDSCNGLDISIICPDLSIAEGDPSWGELKLWPNPFTDLITLEVVADKPGTLTLAVHDPAGRTVLLREHQVATGCNHVPMDLSDLPSGAYHLRAGLGNGWTGSVLVKQ
ncbi:MAG: T9SS type A sorting domain-containing protein [Flavobacteriales bacterium]|nr:T9SS type A sorting domain-containing protein [Flavobacteriales bacterium]MCB0787002.1 T9SS type A sorting domain-containing protein [Flavobacteriales bacterium]MCB0808932.1 T9SS type A sorting domain-containing protein [Flavobacteriales bacterium]MCB0814451.1 T9SS type A sorting domain-containing protein [Flavobacteriales bacterium]